VGRVCQDHLVTIVTSPLSAMAAGAISWTAAEYGLHRVAMHVMRGRGLPSREHLTHHADVTYFSPASKKLASAAGTTAVAWPVMAATTNRRWATAFTAGMVATYFAYEVAHRRIHTHPPLNRNRRWGRRHHLRHHFGAPMRNFGVTTPIWDRLFGTDEATGVITVPRRMAPVWLLGDDGEVLDDYTNDYRVAGVQQSEALQQARDHAAAFTNAPPETT
jgi:hypothetical protein